MTADEPMPTQPAASTRGEAEVATPMRWLRLGWLVVAVHFSMAMFYKHVVGIEIDPLPTPRWWDYFWQTIPLELLQDNALESIWYTHAQPPLFNLYGAALIKSFYPEHLQALQTLHIVLGSLLSGMLVPILWSFTANRSVTLVAALLLAFNPTLFLYEGYVLYTITTAFLVTASVFWLALHAVDGRSRNLICFIVTLNVLILTRSVYHIGLLAIGIPLACVLARNEWRRTLVAALLISLASVGWYGKNLHDFGFFGASSWQGLGLWKVASADYSQAELLRLSALDAIDPMVAELPPYSPPSRYRRFGFDATSSVPALARNNYNNINIPQISRAQQQNALKLIRLDPSRYLTSVADNYLSFTTPSTRFGHGNFRNERSKIPRLEWVGSELLQGRALAESLVGRECGPFLLVLLPIGLIGYAIGMLRRCGASPERWLRQIRCDAPMSFAGVLIAHTVVVSSLFEIGEGARYKVPVEQVMWAFLLAVTFRFITRRRLDAA